MLERVEKEIGERAEKEVAGMKRRMARLERETLRLMEKENYNNNLIYHLRLSSNHFNMQTLMSIMSSASASSSPMPSEGQATVIGMRERRRRVRGKTPSCPSLIPNCCTCRKTAVGASPSGGVRSGSGLQVANADPNSPESFIFCTLPYPTPPLAIIII